MNRVIKFRAWDTVRKEYLSGGELLLAIQPGCRPETTKIYLDVLKDPDTYKNRFIFEQYTGLTDKNGKMIFEGDIFRTTFPDCMAVVTWDTGCARFIGYTSESERRIVYVDRVDKHNKSAIEVIGNVHDDPELIGGEPRV